MKQTYQLTGMTCGSCVARVKETINAVDGVLAVEVFKEDNKVVIESNKFINTTVLQKVLPSKYQISDLFIDKEQKSWWSTYKPVLLIFTYIFGATLLIEFISKEFEINRWMRHFMSGFFLVFSFFKMLNLKAFKESYVMYDVLAKRFPVWSYIYAFMELGLGVCFLLNYQPLLTNVLTLVVMSISIVGVLQSVLNKKKIKCACLGGVFNLPMSTVTIIEDGLMILMSLLMLAEVLHWF